MCVGNVSISEFLLMNDGKPIKILTLNNNNSLIDMKTYVMAKRNMCENYYGY